LESQLLKIALLVKFQMTGNQYVINAQLALHVIQEIQSENLLAQLECTHLKVNRLANPVLQDLCAQIQQESEYFSVLMELSLKWDPLNVKTVPRGSFVHSEIKQ
jgi:hypothetical protein